MTNRPSICYNLFVILCLDPTQQSLHTNAQQYINPKAICEMKHCNRQCLTRICLISAEGLQRRLQADRENRGEQVQHVRLGRVEEQEEAHVRGFERQWEAHESQKDPEKKYSHTLSPHSDRVATTPPKVPWELTCTAKNLFYSITGGVWRRRHYRMELRELIAESDIFVLSYWHQDYGTFYSIRQTLHQRMKGWTKVD